MAIDLAILCPSCYRRESRQVTLIAEWVSYEPPFPGATQKMQVYQCLEPGCEYVVTQHQFLMHEYRARYNRAFNVLLHIRGWTKSRTNTAPGIVWVIDRAVETFFEQEGMTQGEWEQFQKIRRSR